MAYLSIALGGIAGFKLPTLGIFSIHLKGQYQILLKYINLIENQDRDKQGNLKYYTNIVTGQYFTVDKGNRYKITVASRREYRDKLRKPNNVISPRDIRVIGRILDYNVCIQKYRHLNCMDLDHNPIYEEYFMKQIIQYHQYLLSIRERVQNYVSPVAIPTCCLMITMEALCILVLFTSEQKITYSLIWVMLNIHLSMLVHFSEQLEEFNRQVQLRLFTTKWYRRDHRMRTMVRMTLMRCNKSAHYAFYGGFVVYDRSTLLTL
ncbi:hypothetical protein WDU94_010952 [Cyamophila willieti]